MSEPKMVNEILDEATKDVTLDTFLDRHPSTLKFPEDYVQMVGFFRQDRTRFLAAQAAKKAKKEGMEDEDAE